MWATTALTAATGTIRRPRRTLRKRASSRTQAHESAGSLILVLGGLHALMALWHQFVLRDGTLRCMSLR